MPEVDSERRRCFLQGFRFGYDISSRISTIYELLQAPPYDIVRESETIYTLVTEIDRLTALIKDEIGRCITEEDFLEISETLTAISKRLEDVSLKQIEVSKKTLDELNEISIVTSSLEEYINKALKELT